MLAEIGYEGFQDGDRFLLAYMPAASFSESSLRKLDGFLNTEGVKYEYRILEERNWNREWEKNFQPVVIGNKCLVRAPFHRTQSKYPMEIVIEPKMAFGTGHHPTTEMIAGYLLNRNLQGTSIFDMGCGSGILGIIAAKAGAEMVEMADTDPNAVASALENVSKNKAGNTRVYHGGIEVLRGKKPDIITANITRAVLLEHMKDYSKALARGGSLVISGIISSDCSTMIASGGSHGLKLVNKICREDWLMLEFCKPQY